MKLKINIKTPNDLIRYPDFPKQLDGMSDEEYYETIMRYWVEKVSAKKKKEHEEKMKAKMNFYMFDDLRLE